MEIKTMFITDENSDSILAQMMFTFISGSEKYMSDLDLTPTEIEAMTDLFDQYRTALAESNEAKAAAKSAVTEKNARKKIAKALIAKRAQTWRADPSISDTILAAVLVPPHATQGSTVPPTVPEDLSLTVTPQGLITLKWKRSGNKSGTIYNVETASSAGGPYSTYDMTTKSRMEYAGTPGTAVWFRVSAKRAGMTSDYSLAISMWAGSGSGSLKVAA